MNYFISKMGKISDKGSLTKITKEEAESYGVIVNVDDNGNYSYELDSNHKEKNIVYDSMLCKNDIVLSCIPHSKSKFNLDKNILFFEPLFKDNYQRIYVTNLDLKDILFCKRKDI